MAIKFNTIELRDGIRDLMLSQLEEQASETDDEVSDELHDFIHNNREVKIQIDDFIKDIENIIELRYQK